MKKLLALALLVLALPAAAQWAEIQNLWQEIQAPSTPSYTYAKFVSGTGVGNGADTTQDALWTLTPIPANTFTANGDVLILTLSLLTASNANNKSPSLNIGGAPATSPPIVTWNGVGVIFLATITRINATTVLVCFTLTSTTGTASRLTSISVSDLTTNTLAVVVTGASPTTGAANDWLLFGGIAEFKH